MRCWTIILFLIISFSCTDEVSESQAKISNPEDYNMKFIPDNPTFDQEIKLVIADDCTYNVLSGVTRNGTQIEISNSTA